MHLTVLSGWCFHQALWYCSKRWPLTKFYTYHATSSTLIHILWVIFVAVKVRAFGISAQSRELQQRKLRRKHAGQAKQMRKCHTLLRWRHETRLWMGISRPASRSFHLRLRSLPQVRPNPAQRFFPYSAQELCKFFPVLSSRAQILIYKPDFQLIRSSYCAIQSLRFLVGFVFP